MKTILIVSAVVVALLVGGTFLSRSLTSADPSVITTAGIHWHPRLTILVKSVAVPIPANIGIGPAFAERASYGDGGMAMTAIHTHEDMPVIHLEFSGVVRTRDIVLGQFFEIWGRDMRSFGENMRMTVNGAENTEYENYQMRDGDTIVLDYD